jgi:hypothetical protein
MLMKRVVIFEVLTAAGTKIAVLWVVEVRAASIIRAIALMGQFRPRKRW